MIFYAYTVTSPIAFVLSFGLRWSHCRHNHYAKFFVNRFRGFEVLTPRNFAISIGLAGQSYNSVSTAVLHGDIENAPSEIREIVVNVQQVVAADEVLGTHPQFSRGKN